MADNYLEYKAAVPDHDPRLYIIMRNDDVIGRILVHHGGSRTFCNVWLDNYASKGDYCLYGSASGGGYEKENAAIAAAIKSITGKAGEWDKVNGCRLFTPISFDYDITSKIHSSGPRALEEIFNLTVLQAI